MELVSGRTLRQMLDEAGTLPPEQACPLRQPSAKALDAAHAAGLVHRDIKPANVVMLTGAPPFAADSEVGVEQQYAQLLEQFDKYRARGEINGSAASTLRSEIAAIGAG